MTESISNVPVLGGLKKIIEAPFKLVGNTFQTAGSVLNGDTEGFKNGLGGAVNSVFDVPDGALGVLQDGINALRPRRQNTGYVPNRPQQYVGPIPQVEPQPVAYDPALQPPKEYIIPELDIKIEEPENVDDNIARAEKANEKLNATIAKADDADKKLNDTIRKAQEENARLEQNIAKAKDIPATPVAPEPPKAEPPAQKEPEQVPPPVAKAPEKPEENKINWKKWLLIGGAAAAAVGLFFLFKGRGSKPVTDLIQSAGDDATKLLTNGADDVTKLITNGADEAVTKVSSEIAEEVAKRNARPLTSHVADAVDASFAKNLSGKSAKESAKVFEEMLKHQDEIAAEVAKRNARPLTSHVADAVDASFAKNLSGKSAKESAKVFEEMLKHQDEIVAEGAKNLKDLKFTVNGQIDAGNVIKVQGKVDPGLVITPNPATVRNPIKLNGVELVEGAKYRFFHQGDIFSIRRKNPLLSFIKLDGGKGRIWETKEPITLTKEQIEILTNSIGLDKLKIEKVA